MLYLTNYDEIIDDYLFLDCITDLGLLNGSFLNYSFINYSLATFAKDPAYVKIVGGLFFFFFSENLRYF